eukprot:TRINITY_DN35188_c0_g1_i1.p1 TRINITY_DN35188_c0_g1~~TRINITY_DN35188_c0_g1_i1.p1  ORF type:complete len:374 (+),score=77.87 TRINITY_DN35188_c0_g1_i1:132-1253(+)
MSMVMLAQAWTDEDPSGFWVSEKLDGVRALWRDGDFWSRNDKKFACPDSFKKEMPKGSWVLDGELWGGRQQFQETVGIVKSARRAKEWANLTFMVFDVLQDASGASVSSKPFEERLELMRKACSAGGDALRPVPMKICGNRDDLTKLLQDVERRGGEGLMLRRPGSAYEERRRSNALLKVKTFSDEEALVIGHEKGKGKHSDVCGALVCETPDGRKFKVGTGLTDVQRSRPPKKGAVITYRYQELTKDNIPRFPAFVGERIDLKWAVIKRDYKAPADKKRVALTKKSSVMFGASTDGTAMAAATSVKRKQPEADSDEPSSPHAKRSRVSSAAAGVVHEKPICAYGVKCYRKNPAHFRDFLHPWLDGPLSEAQQ